MKSLKELMKYHTKQNNVAIIKSSKINDLIYVFDKTFFKINRKEEEFFIMKGMLSELNKNIIDNDSILLFNENMPIEEMKVKLKEVLEKEKEAYKEFNKTKRIF
jgi:hypothetical protein